MNPRFLFFLIAIGGLPFSFIVKALPCSAVNASEARQAKAATSGSQVPQRGNWEDYQEARSLHREAKALQKLIKAAPDEAMQLLTITARARSWERAGRYRSVLRRVFENYEQVDNLNIILGRDLEELLPIAGNILSLEDFASKETRAWLRSWSRSPLKLAMVAHLLAELPEFEFREANWDFLSPNVIRLRNSLFGSETLGPWVRSSRALTTVFVRQFFEQVSTLEVADIRYRKDEHLFFSGQISHWEEAGEYGDALDVDNMLDWVVQRVHGEKHESGVPQQWQRFYKDFLKALDTPIGRQSVAAGRDTLGDHLLSSGILALPTFMLIDETPISLKGMNKKKEEEEEEEEEERKIEEFPPGLIQAIADLQVAKPPYLSLTAYLILLRAGLNLQSPTELRNELPVRLMKKIEDGLNDNFTGPRTETVADFAGDRGSDQPILDSNEIATVVAQQVQADQSEEAAGRVEQRTPQYAEVPEELAGYPILNHDTPLDEIEDGNIFRVFFKRNHPQFSGWQKVSFDDAAIKFLYKRRTNANEYQAWLAALEFGIARHYGERGIKIWKKGGSAPELPFKLKRNRTNMRIEGTYRRQETDRYGVWHFEQPFDKDD
ncbi:MAG: hypothetical protein C5B49_07480 [Bdellovibrio sp.]|nr:MAG: hypothetical protein C5B49_07480 [Bdellovibrio sp.]